MAPPQSYDRPDEALLVGVNGVVSHYGAASGSSGKWLADEIKRGMHLIVIDPRESDAARIAALHLQPLPGEDPAILACLINVILRENLQDQAFVAENASGLDELRRVTAPFTP